MLSKIRTAARSAGSKLVAARSDVTTGAGLGVVALSVGSRWPWVGGVIFGLSVVTVGLAFDDETG